MLESYIRDRLQQKDILLMSHLVLGYPSMEESFNVIEAMVEAGVDVMELQIPFSEPIADGPVISRACQKALETGVRVQECLDLAEKVAGRFDNPFLMMTYYNILFKYGVEAFVAGIAERGLRGAIVPDLPPEEGQAYLDVMSRSGLAPILIFSPTTSSERMAYLSKFAQGFIYCVARKGVTGADTKFSDDLGVYLAQCRQATHLPLAVGFGVKQKTDVDFLKGKADMAVIGTQTIRILEESGVASVKEFIQGLR